MDTIIAQMSGRRLHRSLGAADPLLLTLAALLRAEPGPPQDEHMFWAVVWLVVFAGGGPDLARSLAGQGTGPEARYRSPSELWRVGIGFDRHVKPIYRIVVRLGRGGPRRKRRCAGDACPRWMGTLRASLA